MQQIHTFPKVSVFFFLIRSSTYGLLHHKGNVYVFPSISHSNGNKIKTNFMERAWEIGIHAFPKVWEILFHQIPNLWFTREMNRSFHQDPIALEKTTIPILWEKPGKVVPTLLPKCGCFFFIRFLSYGMLHHTVNAWSFPSISHSIKKYSKTHPLGTAWELVSTLFQNYGWFSSI